MIGSFWNLCRACPSMPVDKLHSEYRSTYRWHEYTGGSRPEVVRRQQPVSNQFGTINEPPLPRRKKCPELAYRHHEFIVSSSNDAPDGLTRNAINSRARSEARGVPSRRSKSAGPPGATFNGLTATSPINHHRGGMVPDHLGQAGESRGLFKKTISKLSTEYRLQFVWPHCRKAISETENLSQRLSGGNRDVGGSRQTGPDMVDSAAANCADSPRKSKSMGALRGAQHGHHHQDSPNLPMVHKKRTTHFREATTNELEPLVNHVEEKNDTLEMKMGHKKMPTDFYHQRSDKENFGFGSDNPTIENRHRIDNKLIANGYGRHGDAWYKEVVELRKKAGEYKCRGWGAEIDPELFKKQKELWDQVSRRSSLSALSLASSVRPITKEEKEKENNKKSSPTKAASARARMPGQVYQIFPDAVIALKLRKDAVRHHLERTTGPDVEEGALLPSPTRDKLMPALPRSREGSPKKSIASRHGSPQKGSPQKSSPKKMTKMALKGRSQSVGPVTTTTNNNNNQVNNADHSISSTTSGSPKRQIKSAAASVKDSGTANKAQKDKIPVVAPVQGERRPRPTTLSTTPKKPRSKSNNLPPSSIQGARAQSVPASSSSTNKLLPHHNQTSTTATRPKSAYLGRNDPMMQSIMVNKDQQQSKGLRKKTAETDGEDKPDAASPHPPQQQSQMDSITEHIIKSPPEPTRVKSPEQIIMRSPDPVNWTVPLDTGKTFTVTQNIREGEFGMRPHSENKVSTPVDKPPAPPASAPPELAEQAKHEAGKMNSEPVRESVPVLAPTVIGQSPKKTYFSDDPKPVAVPEVRYDKPVPGSTLRCLDDPVFMESTSTSGSSSTSVVPVTSVNTNEVVDKARDRFDRFWGGNETTAANPSSALENASLKQQQQPIDEKLVSSQTNA